MNERATTIRVECLECGRKFKTASLVPSCPKCGCSDTDVAADGRPCVRAIAENVNVNRLSKGFVIYATHPDGRIAYVREYRAPVWDTRRLTVYQTKLSTDTHLWLHFSHPRTIGVVKKNGWMMETNNAESA